ncbi:hypothetical protein [Streptomyces sp. bgisy031]|uniref:hypothetical protein n=1 Tax=Streptomyces sp. bgisy031 TaxID=3413772 RepID=UPI003D74499F
MNADAIRPNAARDGPGFCLKELIELISSARLHGGRRDDRRRVQVERRRQTLSGAGHGAHRLCREKNKSALPLLSG